MHAKNFLTWPFLLEEILHWLFRWRIFLFIIYIWTSLIYNTSARHERHECDTNATWVGHKCDMNATWTRRVRHECNTSATPRTRVWHKWKNFDFDSDTKTYFYTLIFTIWQSKRLQGEKQFHYMNYLLEMLRSNAKMRLKSAPQKLNLLMAKAISKRCTLDCSCKCPCTFPHSYTQQRSLIFDKNHFMWKYQHCF